MLPAVHTVGVMGDERTYAYPVVIRAVTSDDQGLYRIVDLRPGVYTVTFTLPGFGTFRRDGIELTTGFTATVNGELKVGTVEVLDVVVLVLGQRASE